MPTAMKFLRAPKINLAPSRVWMQETPTDQETAPEVIRSRHVCLVRKALRIFEDAGHNATAAQISEIIDLPIWNVERALFEMGEIDAVPMHAPVKARIPTSEHVKVIHAILKEGPRTAVELGGMTNVDASTMNRLLKLHLDKLWVRTRFDRKKRGDPYWIWSLIK